MMMQMHKNRMVMQRLRSRSWRMKNAELIKNDSKRVPPFCDPMDTCLVNEIHRITKLLEPRLISSEWNLCFNSRILEKRAMHKTRRKSTKAITLEFLARSSVLCRNSIIIISARTRYFWAGRVFLPGQFFRKDFEFPSARRMMNIIL